ncbi:tetraspanin-10 isoform X2 [Mixophyes fleayi]|uniref:tetraspanin-10 isoform X2 n=1 Tax=Mixophyes fleayi TaxID=3061075 RepID=UPI003F4DC3D6
MGAKIFNLFQKLCSFSGLGSNTEEYDETSSLLPKDAVRHQKEEDAQLSNGFQYYTHNCGDGLNSSVITPAVPQNDWRPLTTYLPDPLVPFIKCVMFIFNFFFFTLGFSILCIGFWGLLDKQSLMGEKIGNLGTDPMLIFLLVGLTVCVLSASGCVGFIRENMCLLRFFFVGITILMFAQCLIAMVVLCFHDQIKESVKRTMLVSVSRYQDDSDLKFILDEIQLGMECCGVQSYQDWSVNMYFNCSSPGVNSCGVPYSCCIDPLQNGTVPNSQCGFGALEMSEVMAGSLIYLGGCVPQLALWLQRKMWDIFAAFLLVTVTELICVLCAQRVMSELKVIKSLY